jgi:putative ABC transport system permease protein
MTALWLAWRDVASRRARLALTAGVVAAGVALIVATELLSRLREQAVASQVDRIAPPLRVVPPGVSASALGRLQLGGGMLAAGTADRARRVLAGAARAVEEALVVEEVVAGARVPVIGVGSRRLELKPGEAAAGALLAERAGLRTDAPAVVTGRTFRVAAVLPPAASADDLALFVPLAELQAARGAPGAVNEVRIFLRAGASAPDAEARLRAALHGASVIRVDRGEVADRDLQESLARHRALLYAVTAAVVAGCLFLASHLDASERRLELATLVAVGGTAGFVLRMLALRSALVGALGGIVGSAAGVAVALTWAEAGGSMGSALTLLPLAVVGAAGLAAGAALPTALRCAIQDPVSDLQEGAA